MKPSKLTTAIICLAVLPVADAQAQIPKSIGEHGVAPALPDGFKYVPLPPTMAGTMMIFTPEQGDSEPYNVQVVVTVLRHDTGVTIDSQYNKVRAIYEDACKNVESQTLAQGLENNYPFQEWVLTCGALKDSGKPKFSVIKSIFGQHSEYFYQYEVENKSEASIISKAIDYLKTQKICDDTSDIHACPLGVNFAGVIKAVN